jgi:RNA polymerase sigma-70 factor (ECF subfamily)
MRNLVLGWLAGRDRGRDFEEIALVHLDTLYRTALRLTHNRAEAEDLVQDTCLRAFRSFHRFDPGSNCRAWLLTIMRNLFLNRLRQKGRETLESDLGDGTQGLDELAQPLRERASPADEFLHTVVHGDIDRALKGLPLAFREAVVLADLEGLSYREIAEVMGCPVGTVMSRLSRGRHLLRRALGRLAQEHGYSKES